VIWGVRGVKEITRLTVKLSTTRMLIMRNARWLREIRFFLRLIVIHSHRIAGREKGAYVL